MTRLERFTMLLPETLLLVLKQEALRTNRSVSAMARQIIEDYFKDKAA